MAHMGKAVVDSLSVMSRTGFILLILLWKLFHINSNELFFTYTPHLEYDTRQLHDTMNTVCTIGHRRKYSMKCLQYYCRRFSLLYGTHITERDRKRESRQHTSKPFQSIISYTWDLDLPFLDLTWPSPSEVRQKRDTDQAYQYNLRVSFQSKK